MACKFRADHMLRSPSLLRFTACLLLSLAAGAVQAEKADRNKPIVMEADRPGTLDYQRQVLVFNGNAVITQGTMVLRAERIELREMPDGYRAASAIGLPGKPATWRQKRDGGTDEVVEGSADRIEFDGRADTLRFVGNGAVRRLAHWRLRRAASASRAHGRWGWPASPRHLPP
jgi:lipopolysaccharide export system protein LptA